MSETSYLSDAAPGSDTFPSEAQLLIVAFLESVGTTNTNSLRSLTGLGDGQLRYELDTLQAAELISSTDEPGLDIANIVLPYFGVGLYRLRDDYADNPCYQRYFGAEQSLRSGVTERSAWDAYESAVWRYFGLAYALVLLLYIGRVLADMFLSQPLGGLAGPDEVFGLVCPVLALTVASAGCMPVFADSESRAETFTVNLISRIGLVLVPIMFVIAAIPETAVGRFLAAALS